MLSVRPDREVGDGEQPEDPRDQDIVGRLEPTSGWLRCGMLEQMRDPTSDVPQERAEGAEPDNCAGWLATVPATVDRLAQAWSLRVEPPLGTGTSTSWVAPARDAEGADLVLKVGWAHWEAAHEADGLRVWDGYGAIRVYAAEAVGDTSALLLERCRPGSSLSARPELEQDEILAQLLPRLWVTPPIRYRFRSLTDLCRRWAAEASAQLAAAPGVVDPGLARDGLALLQALPASAEETVLLATDAHAGNVLASQRGWLLADPKPFIGDKTFDVVQHLLNCEERLQADPPGLVGRTADLFGVDSERLCRWVFARCVQESPSWPPLADVARRLRVG